MKALLFISLSVFIFSCDSFKEPRKCKIQQYQTGSDATNDLLFWYLIMNNQTHSYYYYSSPTPVSNFSSVSWSQTNTIPTQLDNLQPVSEIEEPLTELPNEIEVEMEAEPATNEAESSSTESNSESNSSSESSSGDSGGSSGDSGGGDGGGAD